MKLFKIDKRTRKYRNRKLILARITLGALVLLVLYSLLSLSLRPEPLISPLSDIQPLTEEQKERIVEDYKETNFPEKYFERIEVKKVEAQEEPTSNPLAYIRWKGQQEGYDDYTISYFIRIARKESGFSLDTYAKNPKSSAKGVFQFIDSTWAQYCSGDVNNFVDNISCFYKVLSTDGYPEGLKHWNASRYLLDY